MNTKAQSVLWLIIIVGWLLMLTVPWVCVVYDAIQESNKIDQVIQGERHEEV